MIQKWEKCLILHSAVLCCYSEGSGQAEDKGKEEPFEIQQRQVQDPAPGEEQPCASVQAGG